MKGGIGGDEERGEIAERALKVIILLLFSLTRQLSWEWYRLTCGYFYTLNEHD